MTDGPQITGIDLHGYFVKDLDRARAFYRDVMELPFVDGKQNEFELPDGSTFGLYAPQPGDGIETWHRCYGVMFAVPNAKQSVEVLRRRGVSIADPIETPVCFMAFGEDSEGNQLIIHQRKAG